MNLYCIICCELTGAVVQAWFVMNGLSVCIDHSYYIEGGQFETTLERVLETEAENEEREEEEVA